VDGLTRTFAKELGQRKIRVNSINPGPIETEGTHSTGFIDRFQTLIPSIPLGRIGQPQDIAPGVVFLASSDSEWMTGETLYVTGGLRYFTLILPTDSNLESIRLYDEIQISASFGRISIRNPVSRKRALLALRHGTRWSTRIFPKWSTCRRSAAAKENLLTQHTIAEEIFRTLPIPVGKGCSILKA
jgi:hypothetical protein